MKLKISFEITEKDLQEALLPNGGKITSVETVEEKRRATRNTQQKTAKTKPSFKNSQSKGSQSK